MDFHGMLPTFNFVFVEVVDDSVSKTAGGLYIPDASREKQAIGVVISKGPEAADIVGVGDKVMYSKYAGTKVESNNKDCLLMRDSDIYAVLEKAGA